MVDALRQVGQTVGLQAVAVAPVVEEVRAGYPWARSVICAAISYLPPEEQPPDDAPRGLVARFARSRDYHGVMRAKLAPLAELIASCGARAEVRVDTCPLPERKLAVLAGIAWRGKNGNVFVEGCGSYAALGEIVTDLDPPHGRPLEIDRCGDCRRCIDACPTGAIGEPYVVVRARCISHLTQVGGAIPEHLRSAMGSRIYGCDVCQEVCPHNEHLQPITPEFGANVFPGAFPELIPLIELSTEEFRKRVKASSIGWIGRTRIRRNAAIAAGNLRAEEAIRALEEMSKEENPVPRNAARWALGDI